MGCYCTVTIIAYFYIKKKKLQSGGAGRWRVCYQRGLPRLVFWESPLLNECFVWKWPKNTLTICIKSPNPWGLWPWKIFWKTRVLVRVLPTAVKLQRVVIQRPPTPSAMSSAPSPARCSTPSSGPCGPRLCCKTLCTRSDNEFNQVMKLSF